MRSWRVVIVGLLGTGIFSCALVGAGTWRDKVASAVLRWIDSGSSEERVVLVRLQTAAETAPASVSYASASHTAWLSTAQEAAADVTLWATAERTLTLERAGGTTWERGLPYIHSLRLILAKGSLDGVRQIAQLGAVLAVLDGASLTPIPTAISMGAAPPRSALDVPAPAALLARSSVSEDELEAWATALGWRYVARQDVVVSESLEAPLLLSPSPAAPSAPPYAVAGLAVSDATGDESAGASLAASFSGASWASPREYLPTTAELAELLEAMDQTGADEVAIAPIVLREETTFLYVLLRTTQWVGWASPTVPGQGTTTQNALVRAEAPASISATLGSHADRVIVSWQSVAGASTYEILRSSTSAGVYDPIAIALGTAFEDTGVETCVQYSYLARAIDPTGVGAESAKAAGYVGRVPMPPARIWTDGGAAAGAIRVEWTPAAGSTGYQVMRSQFMTGSTKVAAQQYTVGYTSEPYLVDTDVIVGQTYLYRVFARNGCGQSELSPQAKGIATYSLPPSSGALAAPSWVETTRGEPRGEVLVSWTSVPGADAYIILRSLAYKGEYAEVARVTGTAWHDRAVELCGDYWYRVESVAGATVSAPSPILYGSYGYRPEAPDRVHASQGTYSQSIRVDWASVVDASSYQVSRAPAKEGPYAVIASVVTGVYYLDEGLSPGQTFWYKVRATNPCGCSGDIGASSGSTARDR